MAEIYLRPIKQSDLEQLYNWRNNSHIMARTRQYVELEWNNHLKWFDNIGNGKDIMRVICRKFSTRDINIGVCGLTNIDYINRSAEVSLYIGEDRYKRKGYGLLAVEELKNICFNKLNLHRLWAEVYSFNKPMMDLLIKCGFGFEGTLRDTIFREGEYHHSTFYNFLEDTWKEQKK